MRLRLQTCKSGAALSRIVSRFRNIRLAYSQGGVCGLCFYFFKVIIDWGLAPVEYVLMEVREPVVEFME